MTDADTNPVDELPSRAELPYTVAVTGTNGKTSVVEFGRQLLDGAGVPASTFGSLDVVTIDGTRAKVPIAPRPSGMPRFFAEQRAAGARAVLIEAFSRTLSLGIYVDTTVDVAVFTGIQLEHLESHHDSPPAYLRAKRRLFDHVLADDGVGIIATNAEEGHRFAASCERRGIRVVHCGLDHGDVHLAGARADRRATCGRLVVHGSDHGELRLPFPEPVTCTNAMLAMAAALEQGADVARLCEAASSLRPPPGRMEVVGEVGGATVIVDSCHNPSAVGVATAAGRARATARLITVLGAGGNRDPRKRPRMGSAAAERSDLVIVTDDNPRMEDPATIRAGILRGCPDGIEIGDRRAAIHHAIGRAEAGDVVLLAGKGEENGIRYGDRRVVHDDRVVAREVIGDMGGLVRPPHPLTPPR